MLHIINKSPFSSSALTSCLCYVTNKDAVLLIEDAVIAACNLSEIVDTLNSGIRIYALRPDLIARGLIEKVSAKIQLVNYEEFVDLTIENTPIQSWP